MAKQAASNGEKITLWAAWGALINKRKYLKKLFADILQLPAVRAREWVTLDTEEYNPAWHTLYVKKDTKLVPINIRSVVKMNE